MVDKNDTLLREVDDELRRERMEKLWEKYGIYALGAAALVVALVGGFKFMEQKARKAAEAGGAQYEQAMTLARAGKEDEAAKAFQDLATGKNPGYAALADLKLAGSHLKAGRPKDALEAFDKLGVRGGIDPMIQGFAQLQAASLRLGDADFTEMQNRLTPLTSAGSPWRMSAAELLGTAAFKAGKVPEARALLSPLLGDPVLPRRAAERVTLLMTAIANAEQPVAPAAVMPAAPEASAPKVEDVKPDAKIDQTKTDQTKADAKKVEAKPAEPAKPDAPVKADEAKKDDAKKPDAPKK